MEPQRRGREVDYLTEISTNIICETKKEMTGDEFVVVNFNVRVLNVERNESNSRVD